MSSSVVHPDGFPQYRRQGGWRYSSAAGHGASCSLFLYDARHGDLLRRYPLPFLELLEQELESIPVGPYGVGAHILLPGQVIGHELRQVDGKISWFHMSHLPCSG